MAFATQTQRELADALFTLGAIQFGAFRLKLHETQPDAPLSPLFLNLRTPENPKPGPLLPEVVEWIASEMYALMRHNACSFAYIAGVPRAGDPFADALCRHIGMPKASCLLLEKSEGPDGRKVSGMRSKKFETDQPVLLVDDLITGASSKQEAIETLRGVNLHVHDVVVLVDREQGGREQLKRSGQRLHAVFRVMELLDFYVAAGYVKASKRDEVRSYLSAN